MLSAKKTGAGPQDRNPLYSTAVWAVYDLSQSVRSGTVTFRFRGTFSDNGRPVAVRIDPRSDPGPQRRSFTLTPRKPGADK